MARTDEDTSELGPAFDELIASHAECLACEAGINHNGALLRRDVVRRLAIDGDLLAWRLGVGEPSYFMEPGTLPLGVALEHAEAGDGVPVAVPYEPLTRRRYVAAERINAGQAVDLSEDGQSVTVHAP